MNAPTINPFLSRSMIRDPDLFFGREREIRSIFNRLSASHPQSVAVVGMRRIGKSSLLYHITQPHIREKHLADPEAYLFTYLDLQSIRGADTSVFFGHLGDLARSQRPGLNIPDIRDQETFLVLVRALEALRLRWVILLDEFEVLTRNSHFGPEFFSFLRSAANNHDLAYITSTGVHLEKLCHTKEIADSPFFNIFTSIRLAPFSRETSRSLVIEFAKKADFSLEDHAQAVIDRAGQLPIFLQMGCAALVDYLMHSGIDGAIDWQEVQELFMGEARSHYHYMWRGLTDQERYLLHQVAGKGKINRRPVAHLIRSLSRDGYIEEKGGRMVVTSTWFEGFVQEMGDLEPPARTAKRGWLSRIVAKLNRQEKRGAPKREEQKEAVETPSIEAVLKQYAQAGELLRRNHVKKLTIMFTDIKGSTTYFELYGDLEGISMIQQHNELLFPVIEEKKGKIVKTIGDAIMACFDEPLESLKAAIDMQRVLHDFNRSLPPEKQIHIRIALNLGEGVIKGGDVFGDVVNTASRMESLADGDQIIISEGLYEVVKTHLETKCRFLSSAKFKGKHIETRVFEVLWNQ